ncbi:flavin monoamine oxidase family protein [Microbacterium sp. NPDC089698]|uniref:flavin monoamine oxidase family protein n=1 Tax=Microbacterium sp. NPDC089698 TaxID=3364200 RepID=UPI00380410CA
MNGATMIDTLVVGAGISGITAARLLHDAGQRVVVLEARNRIGGRMWTDREAGFPVDRGASWIHGLTGNPLTALVESLGIRTLEFTVGAYQAGGRPIANFDANHEALDEQRTQAWLADADAADRLLGEKIASSLPGTTYAQAIENTVAAFDAEADRKTQVREFLHHRTEEQCGAESSNVDAHGLDEDIVEGDEVVFPDGYDTLPRLLAEGLDIRLSQVVTAVERTATGARVTTESGVFEAAHVVVTVPLGVLHAGDIVFDPPLPAEVADAIGRIGMGVFNKIFLRFPKKFWGEGFYAIRQLGAASTPWHSWYDVSAISGEPMLLTFAGGAWGRQIEGMEDEAIVDSVLTSLRRAYGEAVPTPVDRWITRWGAEEFSRGSYSYIATGASHDDHDTIATPIGDVLQLAGEATWSHDPATVHGALLSGHRAAERILRTQLPLSSLATSLAVSTAEA